MVELESFYISKWLLLTIIVSSIIIIALGLFSWYSHQRQRNKKNRNKPMKNIKPVQQQKLFQKIEYLSSPPNSNLPIKSRSITSLQFTNTDIAYLDKLVRTASDRSMWTRDHSKSNTYHKSRRVPSGQIYYKT